ncbi:MAG: flippase-like domain-containing protein [Thermoplasmatales archaeon]|nr:flippase-like domain-containing protein [Thermoplasmatales archaeon]
MFKERTRKTGKLLNKDTIIKYTKRLMPLIGIFLLIYLIVDIGTDEIASTFLKISPFLIIISASLTLPRMLIRNYVWQIILKKQKINVSFITSLKIFLIGYFYGSITPGYVGQLMRIPYLKEKTNEPTGKLFVNLIVEEGIHTLSLYLMMIIGAFLIINKVPEIFLITCVFLVIILGAYGFFIKKERGEKTFHLLIKLLIPKKFKPYLTRFVDSFYKDFPSIKSLIYPFIIVIPSWIIIYSQIYILGLSLDIEVPYFEFLMLYSIANVVAFIPITSAGLGTREATLIFLFSFYGVSPEKALVLSLAGHLITDALTGFYGFIVSVVEARNNKKNMTLLEIEDTLKKET